LRRRLHIAGGGAIRLCRLESGGASWLLVRRPGQPTRAT
jgi:hypothetical protein